MKRLVPLVASVMFVLCAGCGDSHESLGKESITTLKQLVATLEGVKDEASAKSAKPKLKSLMEQLNDINAREAKLGAPTEAEIKSMEAKYGSEMEELQAKFASNMMRIAFDPKIQSELADLDKLGKPGR
jgi:hypothetical protein